MAWTSAGLSLDAVARIIQVSVGAPYDAFARDMARLIAEGASLDEIVTVARSHGVEVVDPISQEWLTTWRNSDPSTRRDSDATP